MTEAVRLAVQSAQTQGARRITGLRLRVGTLSGAVPEAMAFAWDVVREETIAAEATLKIETIPAACWCHKCKSEFECKQFWNVCPACQELSTELRRGRELEIASIELE